MRYGLAAGGVPMLEPPVTEPGGAALRYGGYHQGGGRATITNQEEDCWWSSSRPILPLTNGTGAVDGRFCW